MEGDAALMVRRTVRHDVVLSATIAVAPEHATTVRFSPAAGGRDGWLEVDVVDFSGGGVGLVTSVLLPRLTLLIVRVPNPGGGPPLLEARCRVQRVSMTDRRPAYLIGTSFEDGSVEAARQIRDLLALLGGEGQGAE